VRQLFPSVHINTLACLLHPLLHPKTCIIVIDAHSPQKYRWIMGILVELRFPGKSSLRDCCYLNVYVIKSICVFPYIIWWSSRILEQRSNLWGSLCDWDIFFIKKFPEANKHNAHHSLSGELKVLTNLLYQNPIFVTNMHLLLCHLLR
jgi:hypothetical protein